MSEGLPGIIVIAVLLIGLLAAILVNAPKSPSTGTGSAAEAMGLQLTEADVVRPRIESSQLLPWGWCLIAVGLAAAGWAWFFMDITPIEYSDTVNIDAVSQRAMLHTAGLVTAAIGAVCACAGHLVNEVRLGR